MKLAALALAAVLTVGCEGQDNTQGPTVVRWVDGDTVEVNTAAAVETVRLLNVDTPEFRSYGGRNECVAPDLAKAAAARAQQLAPIGAVVRLQGDAADRYGRRLARVSVHGVDVGDTLVNEGLARRWPDGACPTGATS